MRVAERWQVGLDGELNSWYYGAPSGTTGLFLGFAPMGIEWKISSRVFLVVHGLSVALPIPKLGGSGAPFAYTQYRTTLAVEIAL